MNAPPGIAIPPMEASKSPVFVVGAARSGTTLLQQMLDHHSSFAFPWESHFIPFFHRWLALYGNLEKSGNRERLIRDIAIYVQEIYPPEPGQEWVPGLHSAAPQLAEMSGPSFSSVVDTLFRFATRDRLPRRWGDKTPIYVNSLPVLLQLFPGARFVHIIRDGRDVAASVLNLKWGPNSVYAAAHKWKTSVNNGLRFAENHPDKIHALSYECLIDNPERELRAICAFLGEEYEPAMLEFHMDAARRVPGLEIHRRVAEPVNRARIQRWRNDLSAGQIRIYEAVAGDLLASLQYQTSGGRSQLTWRDRMAGAGAHLTRMLWQESPAQRLRLAGRLLSLACRRPTVVFSCRRRRTMP